MQPRECLDDGDQTKAGPQEEDDHLLDFAKAGARLAGAGAVDAEPALVSRRRESRQEREFALLGIKGAMCVCGLAKTSEGRRDLRCQFAQPVD